MRAPESLEPGLLKCVAVIAAIVWGLSILGINTTAVLAGVGIVGSILGFGAQSLIEDIITGAFIVFEKDHRVSYQPNCDATVTQLWLYLQHCSIFLTGRSLYANLHPYK